MNTHDLTPMKKNTQGVYRVPPAERFDASKHFFRIFLGLGLWFSFLSAFNISIVGASFSAVFLLVALYIKINRQEAINE